MTDSARSPAEVQSDSPTVDLRTIPADDSPTLVPPSDSGLEHSQLKAGDSSHTAPGSRLGKYELHEMVGRGGMGEVWRATDTELSRTVAVKRLPWASGADLTRLRREAQIIGKLQHPHIAPLYDFHTDPPFLAMQFIDGVSIDRAPGDRIAALRDAARAVHYAHEQGILHRDVKPANIMVSREGQAFVLDFGLAREVKGDLTAISRTGDLLGTPSYMAPEQANGETERIGPRTDVYGLGGTLYAILAGRAPFNGATTYSILKKVIEQDPPSPGGNADLVTIAMKCLEKEPAKRYESAAALADDLQRFLDNEPIHARPASAIYRLRKRIQRRPLVALLLLLLVLGTGFELATLLYKNNQLERQAAALDAANQDLEQQYRKLERERERLWLQGQLHEIAQKLGLHEDALARRDSDLGAIYADLRGLAERLGTLAEAHPAEGAVRYLRARAYLLLQEEARAVEEFAAALEGSEGHWPHLEPLAYFGRAEAQLRLVQDLMMEAAVEGSGVADEINRVVERMLEDFRLAGEGDLPAVPRTVAELWIQFNRQELFETVARATEQIANGGRSEAFYLLRGLARPLDERLDSIADFEASLRLHWAQPRVHFLLGKYLEDASPAPHSRHAERALASYGAAIRLKPDYWLAYHRRGQLHLDRGAAALALADFDRVRSLKPDFAEAHFYTALALRETGRWADAVEAFDHAVALNEAFHLARVESARTEMQVCNELLAEQGNTDTGGGAGKGELDMLFAALDGVAQEKMRAEVLAGADYLAKSAPDDRDRFQRVQMAARSRGGVVETTADAALEEAERELEDRAAFGLFEELKELFMGRPPAPEAVAGSAFPGPPPPEGAVQTAADGQVYGRLWESFATTGSADHTVDADELTAVMRWEVGKGEQLLLQQRLGEALEAAHVALQLDLHDPRGYLLLGDVLVFEGELDAAEEAYTQALACGAPELPLRRRRALVRYALQSGEGASEDTAHLRRLQAEKSPTGAEDGDALPEAAAEVLRTLREQLEARDVELDAEILRLLEQ